jgi:hypothetical protein
MQRNVYHLVHRNADARWHITLEGQDVAAFGTKEEALREGEARGHRDWTKGNPAQLVIHRQDGSIERESTYGNDPRDVPG